MSIREIRKSVPRIVYSLLSVVLLGARSILAQPAPSTFQARIEEVARTLENNPRLKDLTQQQRIDRVEFIVGNTLFILAHEMGHVLIHELKLPILGREEDAADTFAALTMLKIGNSFSERVLANAAKGWFLNERRDEQTGEKPLYYDEHDLNQQRAYQIVCLMVGSDPAKFKDLANDTKMPESRQESCKRDYANASSSWAEVLKPHMRAPEQPETKIEVSMVMAMAPSMDTPGRFARFDFWRPLPRVPKRILRCLTPSRWRCAVAVARVS
jgi:hypothetical protein